MSRRMTRVLLTVIVGSLGLVTPAWAAPAMRVMVLPFEAPRSTPEIESLGPGTMDSLITALQRMPAFIVLDRVTIAQALKEQAFQQSGLVDDKTALKLGKVLGAQLMITGRIQVMGDKIRISGTFVDVQTGVIRQAETVTGELGQVFDLQDQLAQAFVAQQGIPVTPAQAQTMTHVFQGTANLSAYDSYQRGRQAYLQFSPAGYQAAIDWYRKALATDPRYALAMTGIAETMVLWAHLRQESGENVAPMLEEARWTAQKALELQPNLPEALRAMAVVLVRRGEPGGRAFAQKAVELAPTDAEHWWALWLTGDRDPDGAELKHALGLNPRLLTAIVDRGAILQASGRTDDAIYEFRTALRITPDDASAHNNLGIALRAKGSLNEALDEYRTAIRLDGTTATYPYNLAITLKAAGDLDGAIRAYRAAQQTNPRMARAYTGLGVALREKGQIQAAVEAYEAAIRLDPREAVAWFNLGMAQRTQGQSVLAVASLTRFLELVPSGAAADAARQQLIELKSGR